MSAFIAKGKLYLLTNTNEEITHNSHKLKLVKTNRGLLVMTSVENLKFVNGHSRVGYTGEDFTYGRLQPLGYSITPTEFFIFNSEGYIEKHDGLGRFIRIYRDQLDDIGLVTLFNNSELDLFLEICLAEQELGVYGFYLSLANANREYDTKEFISNSEGISIDELFNHPYATLSDTTYQKEAQPPYYPGSGLVPPPFQPREPFPRYPNPTPVPSFQPNQPFTDNLWNPISCAPNTVPLGLMVQHPFGTNPVGTGTNPYQPNNHPESNDQVKFNTLPPGLKTSNTFFGKPKMWNVDVLQTKGNTSLVNEELGETSSGVYATITNITSAPCVENGKYNHTIVLKVNENDQEPAIVFRVSNCIELEVRVGNRVKLNDEKSTFSYRLKEVTAPRYVSNDYPKNYVPPFDPNQTHE